MPPAAPDVLFCPDDVARLREQILGAGFRASAEEDITANVVRSLDLGTPLRRARIEKSVPKFLQPLALAFAGVQGSPVYQALAEHKVTYVRFVLEKP